MAIELSLPNDVSAHFFTQDSTILQRVPLFAQAVNYGVRNSHPTNNVQLLTLSWPMLTLFQGPNWRSTGFPEKQKHCKSSSKSSKVLLMNINFEKEKEEKKFRRNWTTSPKVRVLFYYFGLFLFKPPIDKLRWQFNPFSNKTNFVLGFEMPMGERAHKVSNFVVH